MAKPAPAGPVPSNQDPAKSAKTTSEGLVDQAKKSAGKPAKRATVKQAASTKGHH